MPNLFQGAPIIQQTFNQLKNLAPKDLLQKVPASDDYSSVRDSLAKLATNISAFSDQMKNGFFDPVKNVPSADQAYFDYYNELTQKVGNLRNLQQNLYDLDITKKFLEKKYNQGDKDGSKFASWYAAEIQNQFDTNKLKVEEYFIAASKLLKQELDVKTQVEGYQDSMIRSIQEWIAFADEKINDGTNVVSQVDSIYATTRRSNTLDYGDVLQMIEWKSYFHIFFFVALFLLVILIAIHKFVFATSIS